MLETFVGVVAALMFLSNPRAFVGLIAYLCVMGVLLGGLLLALLAING